jgi:hypothetical protein
MKSRKQGMVPSSVKTRVYQIKKSKNNLVFNCSLQTEESKSSGKKVKKPLTGY